jgi:hypothetical protein
MRIWFFLQRLVDIGSPTLCHLRLDVSSLRACVGYKIHMIGDPSGRKYKQQSRADLYASLAYSIKRRSGMTVDTNFECVSRAEMWRPRVLSSNPSPLESLIFVLSLVKSLFNPGVPIRART